MLRTEVIRTRFMGWGFRVRADGTRGYVAASNVGFEITRHNDPNPTTTVRDPQRLVDDVRWAKTQAGSPVAGDTSG